MAQPDDENLPVCVSFTSIIKTFQAAVWVDSDGPTCEDILCCLCPLDDACRHKRRLQSKVWKRCLCDETVLNLFDPYNITDDITVMCKNETTLK